MDKPSRIERQQHGPPRGFTLLELMVVVIIIGILMALILTAAMGGVRRAEERATQGLISKLESGLDDRLQALLEQQPDYNTAHYYMAAVYNGSVMIPGLQRVNVIAQYDYIKAEIPDVFVVQPSNASYALNFAAQPFMAGTSQNVPLPGNGATYAQYFLPLGNGMLDAATSGSFGAYNPLIPPASWNPYGTGIFGASYAAAAGFYKNFGSGTYVDNTQRPPVTTTFAVAPAGYDGVDNDGNGLADDFAEGTSVLSPQQLQLLNQARSNHTHKTARAEALYAVLVEGQGPLGSSFSADDFTDKEVQDTDGDGLPEFVDAWGEPLQFYRWPIYFHSDLQRGVPVNNSYNQLLGSVPGNSGGAFNYPYVSMFDPREQDPLDPSQQLLAPSWWSGYNTGSASSVGVTYSPGYPTAQPLSPGATAFSTFFHPLVEPLAANGPPPTNGLYWDRTGAQSPYPLYTRRAFFSKFLIVSSGPDRLLGIARLDTVQSSGGNPALPPYNISDVQIESQARQTDLLGTSPPFLLPSNANPIPSSYGGVSLFDASQDDISNHNYQAPGGVVQ